MSSGEKHAIRCERTTDFQSHQSVEVLNRSTAKTLPLAGKTITEHFTRSRGYQICELFAGKSSPSNMTFDASV